LTLDGKPVNYSAKNIFNYAETLNISDNYEIINKSIRNKIQEYN